jgi:hypothetical protein
MKKLNMGRLGVFMILLLCFTQCKKEKEKHIPLNIILYNKPLAVIQSNLQGTWRLEYKKGGLTGGIHNQHNQNIRWQFSPGDHILQNYNGTIVIDTIITWFRDRSKYTGPDSAFIMKFTKSGPSTPFGVYGIINDSLVLFQHEVADGQDFYFSKSN